MLRAAAEGATVADIAGPLFLSEGTVRNYLSTAITKTGSSQPRRGRAPGRRARLALGTSSPAALARVTGGGISMEKPGAGVGLHPARGVSGPAWPEPVASLVIRRARYEEHTRHLPTANR